MKLIHTITSVVLLTLGVEAALKNSTRQYRLKTDLEPGQSDKSRFANLYLEGYHTGAGLDDAVMVTEQSAGIIGWLNGTNGNASGVTCR
jgi:hypothetical protein